MDEATSLESSENDTDERLLTGIAGGDRDALARLYERHGGLLLGVALRILGTRPDAEDALQDVFVEVWRKAGDYDSRRGVVRAWLFLRMRSRCLDRIRRARVDGAGSAVSSLAEPATPQEDPALSPDRLRARRALVGLPSDQRVALQLAYFDGLTGAEIAARVRAPLGTIKTRLSLGMSKLRAMFDEQGDT